MHNTASTTKKQKASWISLYKGLRDQYKLSNDAIGVFAVNLRFGLDDFQTIASEGITGGGDDKKCDLLYIDKERSIAVVAQCYFSEGNKVAASSNKASDLNTALSWILTADIDSLPAGLQGRADELRSAIKNSEIKQLFVWFVHNLPPSENVKSELKTVEANAKYKLNSLTGGSQISVSAEEICSNTLETWYTQAERTVIVTDSLETFVEDGFTIQSDEWETLSTVVKGSWLRDLYTKHGSDLFSANLRGYLGSRQSDSNINNGIKTTASDEPQNFFVYNNGITALVIDFQMGKKTRKGRRLGIEGISIVNGAQTTGSLSSLDKTLDDQLLVPIRFVKSNRETIISRVVQYNNTQNKIQAADFRSNDPIQERLRVEFDDIPNAEYEGGRRGGASDVIRRSKNSLPSYTVGQALAAFHGDPVTAYDKKSDLWTSEKNYRHIFTERTTARHIVFCYSLLSLINAKKLALQLEAKSTELKATDSTILSFLNRKGAPYLIVWAASQCMETIIGKVIPNRVDLQYKENVSPAEGEKLWEPVLDVILSLSNQLDSAFSRDRITRDGVDKAIPSFMGIFNSLNQLQRPTFDDFATKVTLKKI